MYYTVFFRRYEACQLSSHPVLDEQKIWKQISLRFPNSIPLGDTYGNLKL